MKTKSLKKKSCDNRGIRKVLKDRVPILGLTKELQTQKCMICISQGQKK